MTKLKETSVKRQIYLCAQKNIRHVSGCTADGIFYTSADELAYLVQQHFPDQEIDEIQAIAAKAIRDFERSVGIPEKQEPQYSFTDIVGFTNTQSNLEQAAALTEEEVQNTVFLSDIQGPIDLLWHFNDDVSSDYGNIPALAFQKAEEEAYRLVYIDPSLIHLWKHDVTPLQK